MKITVPHTVTVLFIDDNLIDQGMIKMMIDRCKIPVRLLAYTNAKVAFDYLNELAEIAAMPDLILCDIDMPEMNGWEFIECYSSIKTVQEIKIPFYFISSLLGADEIEQTKTYPLCSGYFHKPVKLSDLNALIEAASTHA